MSISNKDYLNELIAKAEKSWGGVGLEDMIDRLDSLKEGIEPIEIESMEYEK